MSLAPKEKTIVRLMNGIKSKELCREDKRLVTQLHSLPSEVKMLLDDKVLEIMHQTQPTQKDPTKEENYRDFIVKGVVSITHMAEAWNRSTPSISSEFKKKGHKIRYDRNRKYMKNRVITYIKVANDETK